jgi:HEAT repeat protein
MLLLAAILGLVQGETDRRARELVERLRSDKIEEREEATRSLRLMGKAAHAEVAKALRDPDAEVASRAALIFPFLQLAGRLSERILRELPQELEGVVEGKPHAWSDAFLAAAGEYEGRRRHPGLTQEDLLSLARPALAETDQALGAGDVCSAVGRLKLTDLKPELLKLLESGHPPTRRAAREGLAGLGATEVVPALLRSVRYGGDDRGSAILLLARMRMKEAAPDLIRVSFEEEADGLVVAALLEMGEREALLSRARTLLKEPPPQATGLVPVRPRAALLVGRLGDSTDVALLEAAARDTDGPVSRSAAEALAALRERLARAKK